MTFAQTKAANLLIRSVYRSQLQCLYVADSFSLRSLIFQVKKIAIYYIIRHLILITNRREFHWLNTAMLPQIWTYLADFLRPFVSLKPPNPFPPLNGKIGNQEVWNGFLAIISSLYCSNLSISQLIPTILPFKKSALGCARYSASIRKL